MKGKLLILGVVVLIAVHALADGQGKKDLKTTTAMITCHPARNFTLGFYADGTTVPVEDWSAECTITSGGKVLYEGSFSDHFPQSREYAESYGKAVIADIAVLMKQKREAQHQ